MSVSPTDPVLARTEVRAKLSRLLEDGIPDNRCWKLEYSDLQGRPVLYVYIPSRRADGTPHSSGEFLHKLTFEAYPAFPPRIEFVNPDTKAYDTSGAPQSPKDAPCVPKLASRPPNTDVGFHIFYPQLGRQLVCHSLSLDYYLTNHSPTEGQRWTPGQHTFVSSLMLHDMLLQEPYFGGRCP